MKLLGFSPKADKKKKKKVFSKVLVMIRIKCWKKIYVLEFDKYIEDL